MQPAIAAIDPTVKSTPLPMMAVVCVVATMPTVDTAIKRLIKLLPFRKYGEAIAKKINKAASTIYRPKLAKKFPESATRSLPAL
jgi:hypothetical protein